MQSTNSLLLLFIQSLIGGLLAVFTPFVYSIQPLTVGYLSRGVKSKSEKLRNQLSYAFAIVLIFTLLGVLLAMVIKFTGVLKYTGHWIFNFFFCRLFFVLGLALLGAFKLKLPAFIINSTVSKAKTTSFRGIFYMALTLPFISFSSTAPIIVLVLIFTLKAGIAGPVVGLFGFAAGLSLPFIFPHITNVFYSYKTLLNNVQVVLGFLALLIGLKFLSNADISLGWHILDREIFITILIAMSLLMGLYMLGVIKVQNDYTPEKNIYGQEYTSLSHLFIAVATFTFAVYLLPGIWGAPLHGISGFLPK